MTGCYARSAKPTGICDLNTAEIMLLWSARERVANGGSSPVIVQGFHRAFGVSRVEQALLDFEAAFSMLWSHLTRGLYLMPPSCGGLTHDELLLLHLCAAVQDDRKRHAWDVAQGLVGPIWAGLVCDRLRRFVVVMRERGHRLPLRAIVVSGRPRSTCH